MSETETNEILTEPSYFEERIITRHLNDDLAKFFNDPLECVLRKNYFVTVFRFEKFKMLTHYLTTRYFLFSKFWLSSQVISQFIGRSQLLIL